MPLDEEPTVERALRNLMTLLDKEAPMQLLKIRELDAEVVRRVEEELLDTPANDRLESAKDHARRDVEAALRTWLLACQDWMHYVSSND